MSNHQVLIALGSNLGDRLAMLSAARQAMGRYLEIDAESSIYQTEPWGYTDQPMFLNQVIGGRTALTPAALLAELKATEQDLGRQASFRYGPRQIDLDLLAYDDRTIEQDGLIVPHPRLAERAFVLVPLAEVAPDWIHPVSGQTTGEMLDRVDRSGVHEWHAEQNTERSVKLTAETMDIGSRTFTWGTRTYVMAILNLTPDSFSGDGLLQPGASADELRRQAERFIEAGANLLDIGGESTRPGAEPISAEQELERVIPAVEAVRSMTDLPVSIDTYRASVAAAALDAGADMVNDVWALRADPGMAPLIAERAVPVILMHNRMTPNNAEVAERLGGRYVGVEYDDLLGDIRDELMLSVELAHEHGVADSQIILDPGIGFGKTVSQNLELLDRVREIRQLGYPVLIGPSRKSFIGYTLDLPPDERVEGTAAAVAVGIVRGADIVRVHDVKMMIRVVHMTDALVRRG
jgi:dihydropteroate synthase/2-amino-4-hydroxy-6-hydroxymethyldihydropteridine diphosphokinase